MMTSTSKQSKNPKCHGKIYRADVQHCRTKRGLMFSVRLNELKKLSCPGCEYCAWLDDALDDLDAEWGVINICEAQHGELYYLDICNERRDWETGIIDDWDLCIRRVREDKDD